MPYASGSIGIGGGFYPGGYTNGGGVQGGAGGASAGKLNILLNGGAVGGAGDNTTALNTLSAGMPASGGTIYFPAGSYRVQGSPTLAANVALEFAPGALLSIDAGRTVTINGIILAGRMQIFGGAGAVAIGSARDALPQWWGAGLGAADDSAMINAAVLALVAGGSLDFGSAIYKPATAPITLNGAAQLTLRAERALIDISAAASVKFGIQFTGTCNGIQIRGFRIKGTGVAADMQQAIGTVDAGAAAGSDILITRNEIFNCARGIGFDNGALDSWTNVHIVRNWIHDIKGIDGSVAPHPGYGIVNSGGSGFRIMSNQIERCGRHSIYQAAGDGNVIAFNRIRYHRQGYTQGFVGPALVCARSSDIVIHGNLFDSCQEMCISVEPREGDATYPTDATKAVRGIVVTDNIIKNSVNGDISIGTGDATTTGPFSGIIVRGNRIWRPLSAIDPTVPIYVRNGKFLRIEGNYIFAENAFTVQSSAIYLAAGSGIAYTDDLTIEDNEFHVSLGAGGAACVVEIHPALCAGTSRVAVRRNSVRCTAGNAFSPIFYDGPTTSTSIEAEHFKRANPLGYNPTVNANIENGDYCTLSVTNGTAFTIANPGNFAGNPNAVAGMGITYDIANASGGVMGAVTWGPLFKLSGAFVAPLTGKRRVYSFRYDGVNWVEVSRSPADI